MNLKKLLKIAINASIEGGQEIIKVYETEFEVEQKSDHTPLTLADKNCNNVIEGFLVKTNIPILSEEGNKVSYSERKKWEYFWLVDPLDGTKEFVKRNGEFTVKRYIDLDGKICLRAETEISDYPDIEISDSIDFEIWGIVTHTIHSNR